MMPAPRNVADLCTEHAVRVWTRRNSGRWTEADEADLQQWLAAAPENRVAYEKIARVWTSLGALEGRIPRLAIPHRPSRLPLLGIAATLLVVLSLSIGFFSYRWWNGAPTTWTTPRGATRNILLADGTRIVLDADSELESRIGSRARHIALRRGEALLSVAHDAARLFEVEIGRGRITDLGTRFDVENLGGRARVSVLEGRVGLETQRGQVLLEAGHAGGYDGDGTLLPVRAADSSVALWADGQQRHFDADRLPDVLARLERYHQVTFTLTDPQLQQLRLSGTFRTSDLSLFLRTLQAALPIQIRWMDSQHVQISPRTKGE